MTDKSSSLPPPQEARTQELRDTQMTRKQGHSALRWNKEEQKIETFDPNPSARTPPTFEELREIPELRNLASMTADHPCFTNAILAVTDGYKLGWKDALAGAESAPQEAAPLEIRDSIAMKERLEIKTWVDQQIVDYKSLPRLGATSNHMFIEHKGRIAGYEHVLGYLFERDNIPKDLCRICFGKLEPHGQCSQCGEYPARAGVPCPVCGEPLKEIKYPYDCPLNRDQWESQLAGDLFCTCHNNNQGNRPYAYFWKRDFAGAERGLPPSEPNWSLIAQEIFNKSVLDSEEGEIWQDVPKAVSILKKYFAAEPQRERVLQDKCNLNLTVEDENEPRTRRIEAAEPRRDEREAFQEFADSRGLEVMRWKSGRYASNYTNMAWEAWQAARASAAPLPQPSAGQTEGK